MTERAIIINKEKHHSSKYAPVVVFGYKRSRLLERTLNSLAACPEAKESDLFIFIDGPKSEKDYEEVRSALDVANSIDRSLFAGVNISAASQNLGLAKSIISGVSGVMEKYGRAIVVEDDLRVHPGFLTFMNLGLDRYETDPRVYSICGYTNKVNIPKDYPYDGYFAPRSSSWGWATWLDRWTDIDWSFDKWSEWSSHKRSFNVWGGSDCFSMLDACRTGRNSSWAIRFCFHQYLSDALSLFPLRSLVDNDGFDGEGSNCRRYSRFRHEMEDEKKIRFRLPKQVRTEKSIVRQALAYHSLMIRAWSRLMYIVYR